MEGSPAIVPEALTSGAGAVSAPKPEAVEAAVGQVCVGVLVFVFGFFGWMCVVVFWLFWLDVCAVLFWGHMTTHDTYTYKHPKNRTPPRSGSWR